MHCVRLTGKDATKHRTLALFGHSLNVVTMEPLALKKYVIRECY